MAKRIYIVILNWNGWKDTLECLESVLRLEYPDFRIVVCDNSSADGSTERILSWARGDQIAFVQNQDLAVYSLPHVEKPIPISHLQRKDESLATISGDPNARLVLIETGGNLGFAGGCNIGMEYALRDPACAGVWLLNNDTVVKPDSLSRLFTYLEQHPRAGIIGSTMHYYHSPETVQAYGGTRYIRWMARTPAMRDNDKTGAHLDCILGCSMLVPRLFLEKVGLMAEDYFLYFEELDWAIRAKPDFDLGYAPDSIVYHKEGASIGSSQQRNRRSLLSDQYLSRNRVVFTRKFYPWLVPSVLFWVSVGAAVRLFQGDPKRAWTFVSSAFEGLRVPIG